MGSATPPSARLDARFRKGALELVSSIGELQHACRRDPRLSEAVLKAQPVRSRQCTTVSLRHLDPLAAHLRPFVKRREADRGVIFAELRIYGRRACLARARESEIRSRAHIPNKCKIGAHDKTAFANTQYLRGM